MSYERIAQEVEGVLGKKLTRELWTVELLEEILRRDPGNLMGRWNSTFAGVGVVCDEERTFNSMKGVEMVGIEEFARSQIKRA